MRTIQNLDSGWRFRRGDIDQLKGPNGMIPWRPRMHLTKSGGWCHPPSMPGFDDSDWRALDLPHDWAVEGLPDPDPAVDVAHGSRVGGIAWYRRRLTLPAEAAGNRWWLEFEGVYRDCEVWVNGCFAGANRSGYIGFRVDLSEWLRYGEENAIAVKVDASEFEGWWYEGAGIYRHVHLVGAPPLHLAPDGVFARTRLAEGGGELLVDVEVENIAATAAAAEVALQLADPDGRPLGTACAPVSVAPDGRAVAELRLPLTAPRLWTPEDPQLHALAVRLLADGSETDRVDLRVGLRTVAVDAERGLLLNGKPVKLKGVNCHQDFAALGVALPDAVQEHRIRLLKALGANAYRTAHHAPSPALLDACDRLGLLVLDETRIFGVSEEALSQLERLVRRDRSRPSVIMWSLGNEEMALQGTENGAAVARRMRRLVHRLDGTRPTTLAMNGERGEWFGPVTADPDCLDVVGFNYGSDFYERFRRERSDRPMVGTETCAGLTTRGHHGDARWTGRLTVEQLAAGRAPGYPCDFDPGYCRADGDIYPYFGAQPWEAWRAVASRQQVIGCFVWTGFDYRGEPCPVVRWPSLNSNFGILDLCGFPKDIWWYYRAWWSQEPSIHLLPHWEQPANPAQPVRVRCFSNAVRVELRLNGRSHGVQDMERDGLLDWQVPWAEGILEAIGTWPDGTERRAAVATCGRVEAIVGGVERLPAGADGRAFALVRLALRDAAGRELPLADNLLRLRAEGGARLLGVHNGDPAFTDAEQADRVRLFNGLALAVVETTGATAPELCVETDGLAAIRIGVA
jgi:beta-galactosidase